MMGWYIHREMHMSDTPDVFFSLPRRRSGREGGTVLHTDTTVVICQ